VVNIISQVALLGMIVGTMALVIVLSVFNGFDILIKSFFSVFDPELNITAAEGKYFDPNTDLLSKVKALDDVVYYAQVVEEIAHIRYEDRQFISRIKGVDSVYLKMNPIDSIIYDGKFILGDENYDFTVIGRGVAYNLGASVNFLKPVIISVPRKGHNINPFINPFRQKNLYLSGVYAVGQQEVDDRYALVSIQVARELLDLKNEVTSVAIGLREGSNYKRVQKEIKSIVGDQFIVENRYEQHESYYRVAQSERFFIFLTFSFILIIASFNLAGSIAMQILDKRKDIHIMLSFGVTRKTIGNVFFKEGLLVTFLGATIGLILGLLVCIGQQRFGWLKMPGGFAIDHYPVDIRFFSIVLIFFTVLFIGAIISWLPVRFMPKRFFEITQD
jgi:lipoprotein-releasing system permease protein